MLRLLILLACTASIAGNADRPHAQAATNDTRNAILAAEDRRAPDAASLGVLTGALHDADPAIQRAAVRALGRLERPALVPTLAPMLGSTDGATRAETATALAQSVSALR